MSKDHILVTDDEEGIRDSLEMVLDYSGYRVSQAGDGKACLSVLESARPPIDLVLLDIKMPGKDGLAVLEEVKSLRPEVEVVMISGHADVQTAIEATKKGAYDLVQKPLDQEMLLLKIRNALERSRLARENARLAREASKARQILGETSVVQELRESIAIAAPSKARVFITGENGTGKELIARAIHAASPRATGPFVAVNCAAIPRELIESELFGHTKGAFTGADKDKAGKFEQASGGTLFLDEIGDMPLDAQAKCLRVLEEEKVERVGGSEPREIDVRVVSATNREVEEMIGAGEFREDLYYRLNVIPLRSPALRERAEDIPILARAFLQEMCDRNNLPARNLTDAALQRLASQRWPGNVRQLRNFMERVAIMSQGDEVTEQDIARFLRPPAGGTEGIDSLIADTESHEEFMAEAERRFLLHHLGRNDWNIKKTAELLGMQRSNMYKKIDKYKLRD